MRDLNTLPADYESAALPGELIRRKLTNDRGVMATPPICYLRTSRCQTARSYPGTHTAQHARDQTTANNQNAQIDRASNERSTSTFCLGFAGPSPLSSAWFGREGRPCRFSSVFSSRYNRVFGTGNRRRRAQTAVHATNCLVGRLLRSRYVIGATSVPLESDRNAYSISTVTSTMITRGIRAIG